MQPTGMPIQRNDEEAVLRAGRLFLTISLLAWAVLLTLTASTLFMVEFRPVSVIIKMTLSLWLGYVILTPLVPLMLRWFPLDADTWKRSLPVHVLASIAFVLVSEGSFLLIVRGIAPELHASSGPGGARDPILRFGGGMVPRPDFRMAMVKGVAHLPIYWVLAALAHALLATARLHEREKQAAELNGHLARAQLAGLRTQLQPHFLFNTLNSISALVPHDAQQANQMILNLSELLRMSLRDSDRAEISLAEELQLLRHYVDIQRLRFGDRMSFQLDHDEPSLRVRVPALLLQPIVENAIRHGVEVSDRPEVIIVRAGVAERLLTLEVVNTCRVPATETDAPRDSAGVGLSNTAARLVALYGSAHTLTHQPEPGGGFRVVITLPCA